MTLKNGYTSPSELLKLEVGGYETVLPESFAKVQKKYERLASKYAVDGEPDYDGLAKGPRLLCQVHAREVPRNSEGTNSAPALRVTPAMEARITDHVWTVDEMLTQCI